MPSVQIPGATPELISRARLPGGGVDTDRLRRLVNGEEVEEPPARLDPAALGEAGVPDRLEDLVLDAGPTRLRILDQVGSPYIEGGDVQVTHVAEALYVLTADMTSLSPLLACAQLDSQIAWLEGSPPDDQWTGVLSELCSRRALVYASWQADALAHLEEHVDDPAEASDRIQAALRTAQQVAAGRSNVTDEVDPQAVLRYAQESGMAAEMQRKHRERHDESHR